jgi:hypothetical protein
MNHPNHPLFCASCRYWCRCFRHQGNFLSEFPSPRVILSFFPHPWPYQLGWPCQELKLLPASLSGSWGVLGPLTTSRWQPFERESHIYIVKITNWLTSRSILVKSSFKLSDNFSLEFRITLLSRVLVHSLVAVFCNKVLFQRIRLGLYGHPTHRIQVAHSGGIFHNLHKNWEIVFKQAKIRPAEISWWLSCPDLCVCEIQH